MSNFWVKHPDAEQPLKSWFHEVKKAQWETPAEIKRHYRTASILKKERVVFNIGGNDYRLVVHVHFKSKVVFIRFVGTHKAYDGINAQNV